MKPKMDQQPALLQKVRVYRNLNLGKKDGTVWWSVLDATTSKLICHSQNIRLLNVTFKVNEKGRQRVLREKRKNVHAYAVGFWWFDDDDFLYDSVHYNPYKCKSFKNTQTKKSVFFARRAGFDGVGAFVESSR